MLAAWVSAAERSSAVIEISLTESGDFVSQCQNVDGVALEGSAVGLYRDGKLIARATSQADGWFQFSNVSPGPYVLRSQGWQNPIRLWSADTAPPAARDPIVLVVTPIAEARPKSPVSQSTTPTVSQTAGSLDEGPTLHANASAPAPPPPDDAIFNPFPPSPVLAEEPAESVVEYDPIAEPACADDHHSGPCPPVLSPPPTYVGGPTVGDVITTTAGIAGIAIGTVAIYKYERRSERSRRVVSP